MPPSRLARARGLIVLTVLATVGWRLAAHAVPDRPLPIGLLMYLGLVGVAVTLLLLVALRPSGERTTYDVERGAFTVSSRLWLGFHLGWIVFSGLMVGPGIGGSWAEHGLFGVLVDILVVLLAVWGIMMAWFDLPRLELRPEGVRVRHLRPLTLPWEALRRGNPLRPRRNSQQLALLLEHPDLVPPSFARNPLIPLGWDADPWFVADTIRWYVDHPQDRGAVGTEAGLRHLHARLAGHAE